MTAFAPHTTGIPLNCGKDMEVMKQFYDVSSLLEIFTDFQQIGPTYGKIAQAEIAYRGIESNSKDCLWDTEYLRVNDYAKFLDMKIEQEKLVSLRYMRKVNPEAYAYVIKTDRLLAELQG